GRGPYTNYYFSYFEPPDKVGDTLQGLASIAGKPADGSYLSMQEWVKFMAHGKPPAIQDLRYVKRTARHVLTGVPLPSYGMFCDEGDNELARQDLEIYRFLLREGVAGRWSYMFHPRVEGDAEHFYMQRTSRDRCKACIILKCQRKGRIRLYPRGLLPGTTYAVDFAAAPRSEKRTGADLMARGIALRNAAARELIFLNLENRPGSGGDTTPPTAPGAAYVRGENNLGYRGVGIYWAGSADHRWIRYYEVARNNRIIARVSIGRHWFDHAEGWNRSPRYAVRTVDGNGISSPWTEARRIDGEPATFEALGGHFPVAGREGWSAECCADGRTFVPMTWVPPANNPAADVGGTPNQRGGVEGYWEGAGGARVGRGWQQASTAADCARAWTAPKDGIVAVVGRAVKEWYRFEKGGPLPVRILLNDRKVWPRSGAAAVRPKSFSGAAHNLNLRVVQGDVIRFVVGRGSDYDTDLLAWMPIIRYEEQPTAAAQSIVRIVCGGRRACTDSSGNRWEADGYYRNGRALRPTPGVRAFLPGAADVGLYCRGRAGKDFVYSVPVLPGLYAVRLKFAELRHQEYFDRPMHVEINGLRVLNDFDSAHAARGFRTGVDKAFHYIVPDADGNITIRFLGATRHDGRTAEAAVQAIELLPEFRSCVRVNVGSKQAFIDWNSFVWSADPHGLDGRSPRRSGLGRSGGRVLRSTRPVRQATPTLYDQPLYQTAVAGRRILYRIPVQPGLYSVHLKFAELWLPETEHRPMRVEINGATVLHGFDPAAPGQCGMSADRRFEQITPDARGYITISVMAEGKHDAILQGIEID
ncbi:MAG: malectin domain-containing carbohydrate-binding protein, partial [Phycisphaerae bacterium]|nr:malectin domain-containing carbohydrate-binding protein [Phycisphaerae bacterium]